MPERMEALARAEALRGRYISRMTVLERGLNVNLLEFFGVDQAKEAVFRSTVLANMGLANKVSAVCQIFELYELTTDERFSEVAQLLERCTRVRNVLAHGSDASEPISHRPDGREVLTVMWTRRGKQTAEVLDVESIFTDLCLGLEALRVLIRETFKRYPG